MQVGTAFLRYEEADVRDAHRAALAEAGDACTRHRRDQRQAVPGIANHDTMHFNIERAR